MLTPEESWLFLPVGYVLTVMIETPVLLVGLSPVHALRDKLIAGLGLTACTYPIVVLVLPQLVEATWGHATYLAVAETFAPVAECLLFWWLFGRAVPHYTRTQFGRDMAAVVLANLASFGTGELIYAVLR